MFSGLLESFLRKPTEWLSSESESEEDEAVSNQGGPIPADNNAESIRAKNDRAQEGT